MKALRLPQTVRQFVRDERGATAIEYALIATLNWRTEDWSALYERDHEPGGFQWLDADDRDHSVYAFARWANGGLHAVVCIANFTPVPRNGYLVGVPWPGEWEVVVDTDAVTFGGSGYRGLQQSVGATTERPWQGLAASAQIDLPPLSVVWLAARR